MSHWTGLNFKFTRTLNPGDQKCFFKFGKEARKILHYEIIQKFKILHHPVSIAFSLLNFLTQKCQNSVLSGHSAINTVPTMT